MDLQLAHDAPLLLSYTKNCRQSRPLGEIDIPSSISATLVIYDDSELTSDVTFTVERLHDHWTR